MSSHKTRRLSYIISIIIHVTISVIFMAFKFSIEYEDDEFVTVGFGTFGRISSSGVIGNKIENVKESTEKKKEEKKKAEEKEVELPKTVNTTDDNPVVAEAKNEEKAEPEPVKPLVEKDESSNQGRELTGEGTGKFGFELDFGGKGKRKIYSYSIPKYPSGVSKEIDVKLRFTILADGTVGRIFPLIKADTKLETAAINSLRQWRFEPLPGRQKQADQTAVIIFPFRLQ